MKKALLVLALVCFSTTAYADETGTMTTKTTVIVGRPNKPSVVIELVRPTAARAAGAAHEELRAKMLASLPQPSAK